MDTTTAQRREAGTRRIEDRLAPAEAARLDAAARSHYRRAYVFATRTGCARGATSIRRRCLQPALERANERLRALDVQRLPHLTPHSLRRTFASLLYALDKSPAHVMAQMGHSSPALALAVYAKAMRLGPGDKARLKALVEGREWAPAGSSAAGEAEPAADHAESESPQTAL